MLFSPRWSPDGKMIVATTGFSMRGNMPQRLMIFDIARQTWRDCGQVNAGYEHFQEMESTSTSLMQTLFPLIVFDWRMAKLSWRRRLMSPAG